jgi:hypothetical protein
MNCNFKYQNYYFLLVLLTSINLNLFAAAADEKDVTPARIKGRKIYADLHDAVAYSDPEAVIVAIDAMKSPDRKDRIGCKISKLDADGRSAMFKFAPLFASLANPTTARQRAELAREETKRLTIMQILKDNGFNMERTIADNGYSVLEYIMETYKNHPASQLKFLSKLLSLGATLPSELVGDPTICVAMKQAKIEIIAARLAKTGAVGADAGTPDAISPTHSSFRATPDSAE